MLVLLHLLAMTRSNFTISGITCNNCVAKLTELFMEINGVQKVDVNKEQGEIVLFAEAEISPEIINQKLKPFPKYQLVDSIDKEESEYSFKPLLLVISFILLIVFLSQINQGMFDPMQSMRYFMGGFFVCFSFFKFLDLEGFASAYQSYDIIAKRWKPWGYIYPFVELTLGISYIINFMPVETNIVTLLVMGLSSVGVIQAVSSKQKIKCACLGTGFNLPMTTVTIIEDLGMVLMAMVMLYSMY